MNAGSFALKSRNVQEVEDVSLKISENQRVELLWP